ncbi:hypothetical protein DFH94DRAFT_731506 [Russula ochroleuca]|jgi:uncharacterized phage infection (PIP) family protein YhgE|uniref:Uncharacterized protein n=1 Tax=Russula ochroleuca TaxID=152965 RepID=A0A9P5TAI0_9AGAM|nr:hypothetical protein DFH94DRAFT_731506 [Russula ochroleuca]
MAQPNFNTIHEALVGLTHEVDLFPNAMGPPQLNQDIQQINLNIGQLLGQNAQINQQIGHINQQIGQINQNLDQINENIGEINQRLQDLEDVLPVRLYNASISLDNPLLYPPGIAIVDPFPNTKAALRELTIAQCTAVAAALGLAPVAPGTIVADRRRQISDHLGCAMRF